MKQSPHNRWNIHWTISKWNNSADKEAGKEPDEVVAPKGNIIVIGGVREMLKLISGIGGTPFNKENARIYVGNNATPEAFYQYGILATGGHRASAKMDEGFPYFDEEKPALYFQASFGEDEANFDWRELSITNGDLHNSIALNRKVKNLETKTRGTWTVNVKISILDGEIAD